MTASWTLVVENLKVPADDSPPRGVPHNTGSAFNLEGVKSNRLASMRVSGTAGDLVQSGEVLSGGSYLSQSDHRIHFGLGGHARLDKAEVLWPDGKVETLTNLAADRFYQVREGAGVVFSSPPATGKTKLP